MQNGRNGRHHADCIEDFFTLYRPAIATTEPADNRLIIRFGHLNVTKDAMIETALHSLLDARSYPKVHVCNPKGKHFGVVATIPFYTVGTTAGNDFIEVVFHRIRNYGFLGLIRPIGLIGLLFYSRQETFGFGQ